MKDFNGETIRSVREKLKLNQAMFWNPLGITQSGGSRYESGRNVPETVRNLLMVAYGTEKQSRNVVTILRKWNDL